MKKTLLSLLAALALVAAACSGGAQPTTTEAGEQTTTTTSTTAPPPETTTTEAAPEIGTPDNPIKVLFVPSVSAEEIIAGGEILKETLAEATGLTFEVSVPTSYAATINEMCASPQDTMGFIPAQAYVLANELCGVEVALKAKRFGYTEYWTEFITQRDSDIQSLEDIAGRKWAYPDAGSTSGFLVPSGIFKQLGVEPGESFEAGGHTATVRAVYNEEADFGTVFFSPAVDPEGNVLWDGTLETADVPADKVDKCKVTEDGKNIDCDGWIPKDARRNLREEAPDVIQKVRIFALSDPIPNDTLSFGPEFPEDLRSQIVEAIVAFAENDPEGFATAFDAYSWSGVAPASDPEFDFIRGLVQELGISVEDL
ncbi:MAG TPA: phosphate/phosphite/phosphonate ABC transporter substrate-binding protein [Actinobacteria bacterium]|nr:phosphate/phosphite/phosphonate ABC transporter substrate-binding protein [Actinomycetota bacterium]